MIKFEIGKKYFGRYVTCSELTEEILVTKVTDKTVTFIQNGETKRRKIYIDESANTQIIRLDSYSMGVTIRASNEIKEYSEEEVINNTECEEDQEVKEAPGASIDNDLNTFVSSIIENIRKNIVEEYGSELRKHSFKTGVSFNKLVNDCILVCINSINVCDNSSRVTEFRERLLKRISFYEYELGVYDNIDKLLKLYSEVSVIEDDCYYKSFSDIKDRSEKLKIKIESKIRRLKTV